LHLLIRYEPAMLDVMDEAQCFDVLLKSAGYVLNIAPEASADKFMGDTPQHDMDISQLLLRFGCGAERKDTVVVIVVV
jgi:hypothetical protein